MKKLSETYKELGIAFGFPIEITDDNDRVTYFEDCDGYWGRYERDVKGRPTYHEGSNGFWQRWERDYNGDVDYYEDSTGVKKGTPNSAKAYIAIDREFADILKAAPTPPTPEFKRALRAYRDFIIGRI
jgi:hypothetical protein